MAWDWVPEDWDQAGALIDEAPAPVSDPFLDAMNLPPVPEVDPAGVPIDPGPTNEEILSQLVGATVDASNEPAAAVPDPEVAAILDAVDQPVATGFAPAPVPGPELSRIGVPPMQQTDAQEAGLPEPTAPPPGPTPEWAGGDREAAARVGEMEAMAPEDAAAVQASQAFEQQQAAVTARADAERENQQRAIENAKILERGAEEATRESYEIAEEAKQIASQKIDRDRWWNSRTGGQQAAAYIAAAMGGWLNPKGANTTVALMKGQIDADVDAQMFDIGNQKGALDIRRTLAADIYARTGDAFKAAEGARLVQYEGMDAMLAEQQVQLDPAGTKARYIAGERMKWRQAAEAQRQKVEDGLWERQKDAAKMQSDRAAIEQRAEAARIGAEQRDKASRRQAYQAGRRLELDRDKMEAKREADAAALEIAKAGKGAAEQKARAEKVHKQGITGMAMADGSPFVAPDSTTARSIENTLAAGSRIIHSLDRLEDSYADDGWRSDTYASDSFQRAKADEGDIILGFAQELVNLGAISKEDMALVEKQWGEVSLTGARDPTAGIQAMKENIKRRIDSTMRYKTNEDGRRYDGGAWDPGVDEGVDKKQQERSDQQEQDEYVSRYGQTPDEFVENWSKKVKGWDEAGVPESERWSQEEEHIRTEAEVGSIADYPSEGSRQFEQAMEFGLSPTEKREKARARGRKKSLLLKGGRLGKE